MVEAFGTRRGLLGAGLAAAARVASAWGQTAAAVEAWAAFKRRFVTADGRVVDTGNASVSHTEGQGWGLLFAATFDDAATFDRLLDWTTRTLRRPGDSLHAWRYTPGAADPVADRNNATDGDLFIAFALLRAAGRWGRPELARQAEAIGRSVLALLVRPVAGRTLLLPGAAGFVRPEGVVVNPSYYAFPAIEALARAVPGPAWAALRRDGLALIGEGRFGAWGLPPDWVLAGHDGTLRPAPDQAPRYGYDAVRVPLYVAWAGIDSPVTAAVARWWGHDPAPPAWLDVTTGQVADYPAGPGMAAATRFAIAAPAEAAPITDEMDYYTAALVVLTHVAAMDVSARRTGAGPR